MESIFFSSPFADNLMYFPSAPSKCMWLVYFLFVFHISILLNSIAEGKVLKGYVGRAVLPITLLFKGLHQDPFCCKQQKPR